MVKKIKEWIDCPSCGFKNTMGYRKNITEKYYNKKNSKSIMIQNLEGQFCINCNDGFFSTESEEKINKALKNR